MRRKARAAEVWTSASPSRNLSATALECATPDDPIKPKARTATPLMSLSGSCNTSATKDAWSPASLPSSPSAHPAEYRTLSQTSFCNAAESEVRCVAPASPISPSKFAAVFRASGGQHDLVRREPKAAACANRCSPRRPSAAQAAVRMPHSASSAITRASADAASGPAFDPISPNASAAARRTTRVSSFNASVSGPTKRTLAGPMPPKVMAAAARTRESTSSRRAAETSLP
mmetsp:Transcript_7243/g.19818  ORF Transcript_7243/g.19818 Transcript_7243/m.19818 type:complete len:231 (+) Transcript_7243:1118-1810(+)